MSDCHFLILSFGFRPAVPSMDFYVLSYTVQCTALHIHTCAATWYSGFSECMAQIVLYYACCVGSVDGINQLLYRLRAPQREVCPSCLAVVYGTVLMWTMLGQGHAVSLGGWYLMLFAP